MILSLEDYRDREINPTDLFEPLGLDDAALNAMMYNPSAAVPSGFASDVVRQQTGNVLRLQQMLIYRMGAKIGILQSAVPVVRDMLKIVPPLLEDAIGDAEAFVEEAASTAIGAVDGVITSIPIIGFVVKVLTIGINLLSNYFLNDLPGQRIGPTLALAQSYSTAVDANTVNGRLTLQTETADWTSLFMPSMKGELGAQLRRDPADRIVIAWGLREGGGVPRVIIDKKPVSAKPWDPKPWLWHFSENNGSGEGEYPFPPAGGLGMVPGSGRLVSVVQSTLLEPSVIHGGHESLGDPRCGSSRKTVDIDTGTWLPNSASGAASLFAYAAKASAASYTIATQEVLNAWQAYVDAIWEGIEKLWRNESWEGGWGCGPWQNALQGLAAAHCVGSDGQPGGFGAWMPTRYETKLTSTDRNAWEKNNLCTRIVKPAMMDLREMQLSLLRRTPMAAYLPSHGLGSMSDVSVKDEFEKARVRILKQRLRNQKLARKDVVDDWYREQIIARGIGSDTADGGISASDYKPPRMAMPSGGGGRGAAVLVGGGVLAAVAVGLVIRARRRR